MQTSALLASALFLAAAAASVAAAASTADREIRAEFAKFRAKYGQKYRSLTEEEHRYGVFRDNYLRAEAHNAKGLSWTEGVTRFSDLTQEEYQSRYLGGYHNWLKLNVGHPLNARDSGLSAADLPASVDWRKHGAVTPPKDQSDCGSCWAFASAAMLESYGKLNNGSLVTLSTQQLTACVPNELKCGGGGGCKGNIAQQAFTYVQLFGITEEKNYPYTAGSGILDQCKYDPQKSHPAKVVSTGYQNLPRNNQLVVMNHLANVGPLAIGVAANGFNSYTGGIFDGCPYDENIKLNHAVQLVGYGTDEALGDYWLVRNSWGPDFGEDGYIRLRRESQPRCGTDTTPLAGTACKGDGQAQQHVCGTCGLLFDSVYPLGVKVL